MYQERIRRFQGHLRADNLDSFIISRLVHIRYLCGFSGDTGLLIVDTKRAYLLCDSRFHEQAKREVKGAKVILTKSIPLVDLKDLKQFHGRNRRYGYEIDYLTCGELKTLGENLGDVLLIPVSNSVESLAIIKDKAEFELVRKAVNIADTAYDRILGYVRPGLRENEVCAELEYQMKMLGSDKPSFDTIVASGYRSAMPHGVASDKKIAKGDFVIFDFGATYKGYVSDITRTIVMGRATSRQKKTYNIVLKAQLAAIKKVKAGVNGPVVDSAARDIIDKAGYKKCFGHGTGHGIGIYIHVQPNLGPRSKDILKKGMIVTIEPGIYIPDWGGVRIEDDVLVTNSGCRVLNKAPKNLLEV